MTTAVQHHSNTLPHPAIRHQSTISIQQDAAAQRLIMRIACAPACRRWASAVATCHISSPGPWTDAVASSRPVGHHARAVTGVDPHLSRVMVAPLLPSGLQVIRRPYLVEATWRDDCLRRLSFPCRQYNHPAVDTKHLSQCNHSLQSVWIILTGCEQERLGYIEPALALMIQCRSCVWQGSEHTWQCHLGWAESRGTPPACTPPLACFDCVDAMPGCLPATTSRLLLS